MKKNSVIGILFKNTFFLGIVIISFLIIFNDAHSEDRQFITIDNKDYKKLDFKKSGMFYGVKKGGKNIRGVFAFPKDKAGNKSTWYGLYTGNFNSLWKGYYKHTYSDGGIVYQYVEYKLDKNREVLKNDEIFLMNEQYPISKEDFNKVKKYIQYDIKIPFQLEEKVPDDIAELLKTNDNLIKSNKDLKLNVNSENYYALVIGNNNYMHFDKLNAATNDAKAVSEILEKKYGFEVSLLLNADYEKTVNTIYSLTKKLKSQDNLLIYYAGHGELDKAENRGYWLPVDANEELRSKWISNSFIVDRIKATKAKHVLLVVDSCFSGTLLRSGNNGLKKSNINKNYIQRLKNKKTRLVITSGGNEPVVDSEGGQHSLFAFKFLDTLKNNNNVINSQMLFENIRGYVVSNASQTPEISVVHKSGHDGGDFLFFSNNK